jgi:hypothetical protein
VEESLKQAYSGLNPKFVLGRDVIDRKLKYLTNSSENRIKLVNKMAENVRVKDLKEDIGILAYVKR